MDKMILLSRASTTGPTLIVMGVVIVFCVIYVLVKQNINTKKGMNSEDKKRIEEIMSQIVPAGEAYTAAYGHWEVTKHTGNRSTTSYWYYAVGFNEERIYIVPLSPAGGELSYRDPFCLRKSDLGGINGAPKVGLATFYDENLKEILSIRVEESNTKDDKYHPVNIQQKEAAEAFTAIMERWMQEVNDAHNIVPSSNPFGKPFKPKK